MQQNRELINMTTKMIAHRGYSELETENTVQAFNKAAINNYYWGIETDVQITKDGYFIIHHDDTTQRLSNVNKKINDLTLAEIKEVNLINISSNKVDENYKIPELKEYLTICKNNKMKAIIELKQFFTINQVERLIKEVSETIDTDEVIFISFDLRNLILIRKFNKTVSMQLLLDYYTDDLIEICRALKMDLNFRRDIPTNELVKKLHENNVKVNAWTVNDKDGKEKLVEMKVDFITTDNIHDL